MRYARVQSFLKDTGTKACLRERILGGAYFNAGVCDVNHNSLQFSTRILVYTIMRPAVTVPHIDLLCGIILEPKTVGFGFWFLCL